MTTSRLTIGGLTNGVSVYDMAEAYSVFANDGKLIKPIAVLKVVDRNGKLSSKTTPAHRNPHRSSMKTQSTN